MTWVRQGQGGKVFRGAPVGLRSIGIAAAQSAAAVAALIQEAESAAHAAGERLQVTVSRLRERLTEVQAAEEDDRRRAAYEEARVSATNWLPSSPESTRRSPRSSLTCSGASAPATIASST